MTPVPETRPSLLLKLRDARNQQAWTEFLEIYQPLILRLTRRRGLQEADAREVTQEVRRPSDPPRAMPRRADCGVDRDHIVLP